MRALLLALAASCGATPRFTAPQWSDAANVRAAILCAVERVHGVEARAEVARYPVRIAPSLPYVCMVYGGAIVLRENSEASMEACWRHESWHIAIHAVTDDWFYVPRCKTESDFKFHAARLNAAFGECRRGKT